VTRPALMNRGEAPVPRKRKRKKRFKRSWTIPLVFLLLLLLLHKRSLSRDFIFLSCCISSPVCIAFACLYCICLPVAVDDGVERQSVLPRRREVLDAHAWVLGRGALSPAQERLASRQRFILTHHDVRYLQNKRETKQSIDHQITQQEKKNPKRTMTRTAVLTAFYIFAQSPFVQLISQRAKPSLSFLRLHRYPLKAIITV